MEIRPMREEERDAVVALWHRSKRDRYTFIPGEQTRSIEEDTAFFAEQILARCDVHIAVANGVPVGMLALAGEEVDRLYVDPPHQRTGVGSALLAHARSLSPDGLRLYTHVANTGARAFYERHGFVAVAFGISPAPESLPDVEYRWSP